jgi:general secretion pathway protein G
MVQEKSANQRTRFQEGFTLIEVLVVVVILSILAAIIVPRIMDQPDRARVTKAQQDVQALVTGLNLYKLDNFAYPSTDQDSMRSLNHRAACQKHATGKLVVTSTGCRQIPGVTRIFI